MKTFGINWGIYSLFWISLEIFQFVNGIRTPTSWDMLLRSNSRTKFETEAALQQKQHSYLASFQTHQHFPMIVKFPDNCGHVCHEAIENRLGSGEYYSIIDSTHALLYTSKNVAEEFLKQSDVVTDLAPLLPELKIDSNIHLQSLCDSQTSVDITVLLLPVDEERLREFQQFIFAHTESIEYNSYDLESLSSFSENILTLTLYCPNAIQLIEELSQIHEVQWIERYYKMKPSMRWASPVTQSGKITKVPIHRANLTGLGNVIGIADTGLDGSSCFFYDAEVPVPYDKVDRQHRKIVMYKAFADNEDADEHGTLVSGCAAGHCLNQKADAYQYNGVAYEAKIAFVDIGKSGSEFLTLPSNQYTGIYKPLYDAGARVMSMSWGDTSNTYTTSARSVDQFMWDHPNSVILIAAGNDGESGSNTVGSPATCKNGITVGASLNDETSWNLNGRVSTKDAQLTKNALATFSSRGPTSDGRLKPDICGIGNKVTGPDANLGNENECSLRIDSGTSFSTPILAGASTLIRQYFVDGWYPSGSRKQTDSFEPSGSLIKAMLVGSGQALSQITDTVTSKKTSWGDENQGYGRAQLSEALSFGVKSTLHGLTLFVRGAASSSSPYYVEMTSQSQTHKYVFTTAKKMTRPVRVVMAYTDFYGTAGSSKNLINDLDISVTDGTQIWSPMVTNVEELGRRYDIKNNLEFIYLDSLTPNTNYTVTIKARSLSRSQPYALVLSGEIGDYAYTDYNSGVTSGLSRTARILVIVACCVTFCFTGLVLYIGFVNPKRRQRIQNAKEILRILENVFNGDDFDEDDDYGEEEGNDENENDDQ